MPIYALASRGEARIEMTLMHSPLHKTKLYNLYGKNGVNS